MGVKWEWNMSEMGVKFDIIILGWQKSHPFWFRFLRRTLVQNFSLEFLRRITAQNFFRTVIFFRTAIFSELLFKIQLGTYLFLLCFASSILLSCSALFSCSISLWYSLMDLIVRSCPFFMVSIASAAATAAWMVVIYGTLKSTAARLILEPSLRDSLLVGVLMIRSTSSLRIISMTFGLPSWTFFTVSMKTPCWAR